MAWTIDKMITPGRVKAVALELFRDDFHEGDCRNEYGREGQPCRVCAENNRRWQERLDQVRTAMVMAFS